ncbi:hypothetical protein VHUM_00834 [Vanrija humicola]|uniref:Glutamyl-tRNA(Gln) amidotransferase subunit A, mitochondrial n=1 Tax=Vanrija humicola TaxID=5417 RepID=A0A7D8V3H8_VANHU|nr:hypothetical protein VHUM_00834 [Vanrija humicola]
MKRSALRLAQAAKHAHTAGGQAAASGAPSPYSWINPEQTVAGATGPLAGRGVAIKDNISYSKGPTTCSSDILQDFVPPYDATCVKSLTSAGAHIVGKTKMDEFGMGSQTTHLPPSYTPVHNPSGPPSDTLPRSAGGSSGGSAAAVAEGSCWAALGTDTGGSVRLPASYCGVVGLKPSYGLISRYGVVSYADSLDCVGVLGKSVDAVEKVFGVVSHPDENDMTCVSEENRQTASSIRDAYSPASSSLAGLRIGLPIQTHLEAPNVQLPTALLEHFKSLGATLHPVDMPSLTMALPAYYVLASAEAASNLGRFGGGWYGSEWERERVEGESGAARRRRIRTQGFGPEVRKRILAGTYALTADAFNNSYLKALHLRRLVRKEFGAVFRIPHPLAPGEAPGHGVDLLLHPTAVRTAPRLGEDNGEPEYLQDVLTVPASLAGLPAMSVPAGRGEDGWPIGVSLVGQWGMEDIVFRAGRAVEQWK